MCVSGKKLIADYCREKIGKEVRVIVKDDDPINEDGSISQNRSKPSRSRTPVILRSSANEVRGRHDHVLPPHRIPSMEE
ncbi:MAG: hypothetical protein ACLRTA_06800 [Clostridia bacterium]